MKNQSEPLGKYFLWGILFLFFPIIGVIVLIIEICKRNQNSDSTDFNNEEYTIEKKEDIIEIQKDDITQEEVHAHDAWESEGPIKYNK